MAKTHQTPEQVKAVIERARSGGLITYAPTGAGASGASGVQGIGPSRASALLESLPAAPTPKLNKQDRQAMKAIQAALQSDNPTLYVTTVPKAGDRIPGVTYVPRKPKAQPPKMAAVAPATGPSTTPVARPPATPNTGEKAPPAGYFYGVGEDGKKVLVPETKASVTASKGAAAAAGWTPPPNPNAVKTEANPQTVWAYQHTQAINEQVAELQAKRDKFVKSSLGDGGVGGAIEHGILTTLDAPRRVIAAGIVAGGGALRAALGKPGLPGYGVGDALSGNVRAQDIAFGKGDVQGVLKGTALDSPVGRFAVGTTGDIGMDPLTWLLPGAKGAEVESAMQQAAKIAFDAGDEAAHIRFLTAAKDVARLGNPAGLDKSVLEEAATHLYEASIKPGVATAESRAAARAMEALTQPMGFKLAGVGIGGEKVRAGVGEVTSGVRNAVRGAVWGETAAGDNWLQRALRQVGGKSGPYQLARRSGDLDRYVGSLLHPVEQANATIGGMLGLTLANDVAAATHGLTAEQFDNVVRLVESNPDGWDGIVQALKQDGLENHANAVRGALDKAHEAMTEAGRAAGIPRTLPRFDFYFPRVKEFRSAFAEGTSLQARKAAFVKFTENRSIRSGSRILGSIVPEGLDPAGVRKWVNELAVEKLGREFYKLDNKAVLDGYFKGVGVEVGRLKTLADGQRLGFITRNDARTLYEASQTSAQWQSHAEVSYALAAKMVDDPHLSTLYMQWGDYALEHSYWTDFADEGGRWWIDNKQAPDVIRGLVRTHEPFNLSPEALDLRAAVVELTKPKNWGGWIKQYDAVLNWTKAWQLATPGFVFRNLSGGVFNNALAGVKLGDYLDYFKANAAFHGSDSAAEAAAKFISAGDNPKWAAFVAKNPEKADWYLQARAFHQGQFESELGTHGGTAFQRANPLGAKGPAIRTVRRASENVEGLLRGTLAMKTFREGGDLAAVYQAVAKYHFDYTDLTTFEKENVKRFVRPYYTWLRRNLPLQVEMLAKHPSIYSKYQNFAANLSAGVPGEAVVPQYFTKELMGVPTPLKLGGNRVYYTPQLPFADLTQFMDPKGLLLEGAPPLVKTLPELFAGKQFFKDLPLRSDKKVPLGVWGSWMGPALALGGYAHQEKGEWITNEKVAYVITQFAPLIGRMRAAVPSEEKFKSRFGPGLINMLTGLGVRANTPQEQKSELFNRALKSGKLKKVTLYVKQKGK